MWKSETKHISVLLHELVNSIDIASTKQHIIVDCTLWYGGHAKEILEKMYSGDIFIGFDADAINLAETSRKLQDIGQGVKKIWIHSNYVHLKKELLNCNIHNITWIYYDLGLSSMQIDDGERWFSFMLKWPLDMRFDTSTWKTAAEVVNTYSEKELTNIFLNYGEEPKSKLIARKIIETRKNTEFTTTQEVSQLIETVDKHPVVKARIFQALRIYVNNEIENIEKSIRDAIYMLEPGGKIFVISFHSLEDRAVKNVLRKESRDCICENIDIPCHCSHKKQIDILTKKPILPSANEIKDNIRSRSAKGRVAVKLNVIP